MQPLNIILLIIVVSLPWLFLFHTSSQEYRDEIIQLEQKTAELQQKLDKNYRINQQLVKNLGLSQEARMHAEKQQLVLYDKLVVKNKALTELENDDWETRYMRAHAHNESLIQRIQQLEKIHQENINSLYEENRQLADLNDSLTYDLLLLEFELDNLNADIGNGQLENNKLLDEIQNYQIKLKKQQDEINRLSNENEKLDDLINKIAINANRGKAPVKATRVPQNLPEQSDYRNNRIISLIGAMEGRSSSEKKEILISVIPTIPEGIHAEELLVMLDGMNNPDTVDVIQSSNDYINRPVNEQTVRSLVSNLDDTSAELISNLLKN